MLVLSRKAGQKILIGDDIEITVVRLAQGSVRLGVVAPEKYSIVRSEIQDLPPKSSAAKPATPELPVAVDLPADSRPRQPK